MKRAFLRNSRVIGAGPELEELEDGPPVLADARPSPREVPSFRGQTLNADGSLTVGYEGRRAPRPGLDDEDTDPAFELPDEWIDPD